MNHVFSLIMLMAVTTPALSTADLAQKKGCMACHATDKRVLGPAFRDVAKKYASANTAEIERSIREGGSGRWGSVAMPAQPHVTATEAQSLARWIAAMK